MASPQTDWVGTVVRLALEAGLLTSWQGFLLLLALVVLGVWWRWRVRQGPGPEVDSEGQPVEPRAPPMPMPPGGMPVGGEPARTDQG